MMHVLEMAFENIVEICTLLIELIGVFIIVLSILKGIIRYLKNDHHTSISLAHSIALGMEFMIGGEVLHTLTASNWEAFAKLGATIVLRTALTLLLHWEADCDEKREKEQAAEEAAKLAAAAGHTEEK